MNLLLSKVRDLSLSHLIHICMDYLSSLIVYKFVLLSLNSKSWEFLLEVGVIYVLIFKLIWEYYFLILVL